MVQFFLPGWHFTVARAHGAQSGGILSGGLSRQVIISIDKIRMKIFRIISTNYF